MLELVTKNTLDEEEEDEGEGVTIEDMTETNMLALRRTVYLTIMSRYACQLA